MLQNVSFNVKNYEQAMTLAVSKKVNLKILVTHGFLNRTVPSS